MLQLVCIAINTYAMGSTSVQITPAWRGHFQPEKTTELGMQIISSQGSDYRLIIKGGNLTTHLTGSIEPNEVKKLWIPIRPVLNQPLSIELYQSGHLTYKQQLRLIPHKQGVTVTTSETIPVVINEEQIIVTPKDLPRTAQGYNSIHALTIAPSDLSSLDNEQIQALSNYLQLCGQLLLTNTGNNTLDQLRNIAGCNGKAVHLYQKQPKKMQQAFYSLKTLNALLERQERNNPIVTLAIFFSCYLFVLLFALHSLHKSAAISSIPIVSSIALVALCSLQENQTIISSWTEMESGHSQARFSALLNIEGINTEYYKLQLSRALGIPQSLSNKAAILELNQHEAGIEQLALTTKPFSSEQFLFHGTFPVSDNISLTIGSEAPVVTNNGKEESTEALLLWNGKILTVPPLEPGMPWSPDAANTIDTSSQLSATIRAQAKKEDLALLMPYSLHKVGLFPSSIEETGWLLIRPAI